MFTDFGADKFGTTTCTRSNKMMHDKKTKMMAGGGMHRMPDGSMMKDSAMKGGGMTSKMKAGGGIKSKMAPSKMSKIKTSAKPDGVAKKGLTKGKMIGMRGR
jgi:hypothetical protein